LLALVHGAQVFFVEEQRVDLMYFLEVPVANRFCYFKLRRLFPEERHGSLRHALSALERGTALADGHRIGQIICHFLARLLTSIKLEHFAFVLLLLV